MNTKIQCLIDGGFITISDVLEHYNYLENQINDYYENRYPNWPEDDVDEERILRDQMMEAEDLYGQEFELPPQDKSDQGYIQEP